MNSTDPSPRTTETDTESDPAETGLGMAHPTVVPANFDPDASDRPQE